MKKLALITGTFLAALAFLLLAWQLRSVVGILFVAVMLATMMSGFVSTLADPSFWARISSGVFLLMFVGLVTWVYRKRGRSVYEKISRLPFED